MARSSYIYVVMPVGSSKPAAAFTVKHELIAWLSREPRGIVHVWLLRDDPTTSDKPPRDITADIFPIREEDQ